MESFLVSVETQIGDVIVDNYNNIKPSKDDAMEEAEGFANTFATLYLNLEGGDYWEWEEYECEDSVLTTICADGDLAFTIKVQPC